MSTLEVSNLNDGTTTVGTTFITNGSAKAWVNFDATINTIRDSLNVASLTDSGTGVHSVNFTNNMNNDDYSVTNSVDGTGVVSGAMTEINSYSTSSFTVRGMNTSYTNTDFPTQSCSMHGDLA